MPEETYERCICLPNIIEPVLDPYETPLINIKVNSIPGMKKKMRKEHVAAFSIDALFRPVLPDQYEVCLPGNNEPICEGNEGHLSVHFTPKQPLPKKTHTT